MKQYHILALLFFLWMIPGRPIVSQNTSNPFELKQRLDESARHEEEDTTGNPFDIKSRGTVTSFTKPKAEPKAVVQVASKSERLSRTKFLIVISLILLFSISFAMFRMNIQKIFRTFWNDNLLTLLYRESENQGAAVYYLLYLLFFLATSAFTWLFITQHNLSPYTASLSLWFNCFWIILALVLLKHLVLLVIGWVFPISKEIKFYSFTIMTFNTMAGIMLIPVILIMAYGPPAISSAFSYIAIGILAVVYLVRSLWSVLRVNKYLIHNRFHFLLYICTVEVAPIFILIKVIRYYF